MVRWTCSRLVSPSDRTSTVPSGLVLPCRPGVPGCCCCCAAAAAGGACWLLIAAWGWLNAGAGACWPETAKADAGAVAA